MPLRIKKRNEKIVEFDADKIKAAIFKAAQAVGGDDSTTTDALRDEVVLLLDNNDSIEVPSVEDVQDMIEKVLIEHGHSQTAKSFILYRKKRQELREAKSVLGVQDDMKLSFKALRVLSQYNLLQQKQDGSQETPTQMFERVAKAISKADKKYGDDPTKIEEIFKKILLNLDFVPSTSILQCAGFSQSHLSEGFVLPLDDDIVKLFDTLKQAALLHKNRQRGFGLGLSFSSLRPKGSRVGSGGMGETAAGPVSFLLLYDRALSQINPHGANLAFLSVHHPDIVDFITSRENARLKNFGLSVVLSKAFMKACHDDKMYKLIDPKTQHVVTKLRARSVLDIIATLAWKTGDPAVVFADNLNKSPTNPFTDVQLEATTATGEHPLFPHEGCFTVSINCAQHIKDVTETTEGKTITSRTIDWGKLKSTVHAAIHFLDNAIDVSTYPNVAMTRAIERTRRIGVGIMGFADALITLETPYNSPEAREYAEKIMSFVNTEAKVASEKLARKRGTFEGYKDSVLASEEKIRNSCRTTIVHSAAQSVIAGCSQGVEPHYAIGFLKRTPTSETFEVLPSFETIAKKEGFYTADIMKRIALAGSVKAIKEVPSKWRKIFTTAQDCDIADHLAMQIAFQKHTNNGVSKTINLPAHATINEIETVIMKAHETGCKSVHVYREGSSMQQLMHTRNGRKRRKKIKLEV
jgi:ribonucleoside-diphosphate reductase alpha chain